MEKKWKHYNTGVLVQKQLHLDIMLNYTGLMLLDDVVCMVNLVG